MFSRRKSCNALLFFFLSKVSVDAFFFFTLRKKKKKSGAGEREPGKGLFRNTVCGSEQCHRLPLERLPVSLFLCKVYVVLINNFLKRGEPARSVRRQVSILFTIYYQESLALEQNLVNLQPKLKFIWP